MTDTATSEIAYSPGTWVAVAGERVWLLADMASTEPVVGTCWELVRAGAGVDRVVGALLSAGFRAVASFALVRYADRVAEVVVRGGARVDLVGPAGEIVEVRTVQAGDWADRTVDQPLTGIRLVATGPASGPQLPLGAGVVLAAHLSVRLPEHAPRTADGTSRTEREAPRVDLDAPRAEPAREVPTTVNGARPVATVDVATDRPAGHTFDVLFEKTVPPRDGEDEQEQFPQLPGPAAPAVTDPIAPRSSVSPTVQASPTVQPSTAPSRVEAGLIEDVSWAEPVDLAPVLPATQRREAVPRPGPHDEIDDELLMTVQRSRRPAVAPEPTGSGPIVSAVRCRAGHLNPPSARTCRVCTVDVPVQTPEPVSRPTLGVLRLSDGEVIQLDRGVILGRAPGVPEGNDRDRPHRVKLPSPDNDISRRHVEVRLDGWDVVVVDLESRNGTVVTPPGGVPQTLASGESRVIEPGSVVSLTDTTSFRFEVTG